MKRSGDVTCAPLFWKVPWGKTWSNHLHEVVFILLPVFPLRIIVRASLLFIRFYIWFRLQHECWSLLAAVRLTCRGRGGALKWRNGNNVSKYNWILTCRPCVWQCIHVQDNEQTSRSLQSEVSRLLSTPDPEWWTPSWRQRRRRGRWGRRCYSYREKKTVLTGINWSRWVIGVRKYPQADRKLVFFNSRRLISNSCCTKWHRQPSVWMLPSQWTETLKYRWLRCKHLRTRASSSRFFFVLNLDCLVTMATRTRVCLRGKILPD